MILRHVALHDRMLNYQPYAKLWVPLFVYLFILTNVWLLIHFLVVAIFKVSCKKYILGGKHIKTVVSKVNFMYYYISVKKQSDTRTQGNKTHLKCVKYSIKHFSSSTEVQYTMYPNHSFEWSQSGCTSGGANERTQKKNIGHQPVSVLFIISFLSQLVHVE